MRDSFFRILVLTAAAGLTIAQAPSVPLTFERIQNSNREPQNWLTYESQWAAMKSIRFQDWVYRRNSAKVGAPG